MPRFTLQTHGQAEEVVVVEKRYARALDAFLGVAVRLIVTSGVVAWPLDRKDIPPAPPPPTSLPRRTVSE